MFTWCIDDIKQAARCRMCELQYIFIKVSVDVMNSHIFHVQLTFYRFYSNLTSFIFWSLVHQLHSCFIGYYLDISSRQKAFFTPTLVGFWYFFNLTVMLSISLLKPCTCTIQITQNFLKWVYFLSTCMKFINFMYIQY